MLLLVYTFNFVDRQILSILASSIKTDLHLSDAQLGLLGGLAFALALFDARDPARLDCRPDEPDLGDHRLAGGVERLHRAVRLGDEFRPAVRVPARRRRGRGGRRGAVLCADRRLFPAEEPRAGAGDLFARHPVGLGGGRPARRAYRRGGRLAHGVHRRRDRRGRPRADLPADDARTGPRAESRGGRTDFARLRDPRAQAEFLAARVRRLGQLDARLWPRLLAALADRAELSAQPHRPLLFLRRDPVARRRARRPARRRGWATGSAARIARPMRRRRPSPS